MWAVLECGMGCGFRLAACFTCQLPCKASRRSSAFALCRCAPAARRHRKFMTKRLRILPGIWPTGAMSCCYARVIRFSTGHSCISWCGCATGLTFRLFPASTACPPVPPRALAARLATWPARAGGAGHACMPVRRLHRACSTLRLETWWSDDQGVFNKLLTGRGTWPFENTGFYPVRPAEETGARGVRLHAHELHPSHS